MGTHTTHIRTHIPLPLHVGHAHAQAHIEAYTYVYKQEVATEKHISILAYHTGGSRGLDALSSEGIGKSVLTVRA